MSGWRWRKALAYGLAVWLVPLAVAFASYPIRLSNRPLFESVMTVALAATAAFFGALYCRRLRHPTLRRGFAVGLLWLVISVVCDAPFFLGPFGMSLTEYLADVALGYLAIPAITSALGYAASPRGATGPA